MKTRKVLLILFAGWVISMIDSCCGCDIDEDFYYSISDLKTINIDNSGKKPVVISSTDKTVPKEAYGIRLTFSTKEIEVSMMPHVSLIPSVYATSCDCGGEVHAKDSVLSIHITTVNDFDGRHPAGSDVSEYFRVIDSHRYLTLDAYFPRRNYHYGYCSDQLSSDCLLMTAPAITGEHQFQTEARLSDGRTLTSLTTPIMLY